MSASCINLRRLQSCPLFPLLLYVACICIADQQEECVKILMLHYNRFHLYSLNLLSRQRLGLSEKKFTLCCEFINDPYQSSE